jgi:hypothetical protein
VPHAGPTAGGDGAGIAGENRPDASKNSFRIFLHPTRR